MRERILDEEFAKDLAEFQALAGEMGTPYATGRWDIEVVSPGGDVIQSESFHSQSWLRNYVNLLCNFVLSIRLNDSLVSWGDSFVNLRQFDGTIINVDTAQHMSTAAAVGIDDSGIVVGSGTTAETLDDYTLATPIVHGRAAGEVYFYAGENSADWEIWSWNGTSKRFSTVIWRYFLNDSGGDITIAETGVASSVGVNQKILVVRDVLNSTFTVPDLYVLRTKYTVESTVYP